jgi:hypothetical protein
MTADYLRSLAARCRNASRLSFDLYAKEELASLASELDAGARDLDAPVERRRFFPWRREYGRGFEGDH